MARLYIKPSYHNYVRSNHTCFSGEVATNEKYVCRQCNASTAVVKGEVLPLCHTCFGRRFTPL